MFRKSVLSSLCAGVLVLGAAGAPDASADPEPVRIHKVGQSPAEILAYWTPERMAAAKPIRATGLPTPKPESGVPSEVAPSLPEPLLSVPKPYTDPGERVHGKLFLGSGFCSAAVVTAGNKSLVWTAAHCLSGSAANLMFVPAYNSGGSGDAPYGRWPALRYATSGNDHGVVVVGQVGGRSLQDVVGANGLRFDGSPINNRTVIWGYPGQGGWDGRTLTTCDAATRPSGSGVYTSCVTQPGSSGGGYVTGSSSSTGLGYQWANHSAGDGQSYAYGVVFSATAKRLYDANSGGTPPGGEPVWSDDFETDKGWQANPNGTDTATGGRFERGDPQATTYQNATYQQGTTSSGTFALVTGATAGADVGANDLDGGTTSIRSPEIALPAGGTHTLNLQHYLAHLNNSSTADYLRIQVVTATGTTTVFTKNGAAANTAATWQTATANLTPYAGQTIRLLIQAADADTGSLLESAIDDVKITRTP